MLAVPQQVLAIFILDVGFNLALAIAVAIPLIQAKQFKQLGIVSKVVLLGLANACFYLGVLGQLEQGVRWGLYSALYLILSVIFVMARRVLPFFHRARRGLSGATAEPCLGDRSSLVLMLLFWLVDVFTAWAGLAALLAAALFVVHAIRLWDWHTPGCGRSRCCGCCVGVWCGAAGFSAQGAGSAAAAVALSCGACLRRGGIGLMTTGMMARVILGHTGRDIQRAPRWLVLVFFALLAALFARVALPLLVPAYAVEWMGVAFAAWLYAYAVFLWIYAPILIKPRVDGQPG